MHAQYTAQQIELRHYINTHGFNASIDGSGVVLHMPATTRHGATWIEYTYIETYKQARAALGY